MSTKNSPIPPAAQRVLDFFDNELVEARFPDVDQGLLQEAADRVTALAEEVGKAEAALLAAQRALQEGQEALVGKCQRALAYARIYAEEDGDLSRRLEAISLPRVSGGGGGKGATEGKPGRKGRRAADSGGLFAEPPQDDLPI